MMGRHRQGPVRRSPIASASGWTALLALVTLVGCAHPDGHGGHAAPGGDTPAACQHTDEMRQQMARIEAEKDPAEKERLMHEHHRAMHGADCPMH